MTHLFFQLPLENLRSSPPPLEGCGKEKAKIFQIYFQRNNL